MYGQCEICPKNSRPKRLTYTVVKGEVLQVCSPHKDEPEANFDSNDAPVKAKAKEQNKKKSSLKGWYDRMIANAPERCEMTGERLTVPNGMTPRVNVAHILDKAIFPYLATIDENAAYLNWQPHSDFDRTKQSTAPDEPLKSICIERFKTFYKLIPNNDWHKVPEWLKETVNRK